MLDNFPLLLVLLGLLLIPVTCAFPPGSCDGYTNVTEPWRNREFVTTFFPKDDGILLNNWWRFTGIGGDRLITDCVSPYVGGTWHTLFLPFTLPTSESVTPTKGTAYDHSDCKPDSCGPLAVCTPEGGCICVPGFEIPLLYTPTPDSYGCVDIDECLRTLGICGPDTDCTNTIGSYICTCSVGFSATNSSLPPGSSNQCEDLDECSTSTVCGPDSVCTNTIGNYSCACQPGYTPTQPAEQPSELNVCTDVDECVEDVTICGPDSKCINSVGSYSCTCFNGYQVNSAGVIASVANPCTDIDECSEYPGICGKQTLCNNVQGSFYCSCPDHFYPSTGVVWTLGTTYCQDLQDVVNSKVPSKGKTKARAFLDSLDEELQNNTGSVLPEGEVSGVSSQSGSVNVSSEGDAETGSVILGITDLLVSAMISTPYQRTKKRLQTSLLDLSLEAFGPGDDDDYTIILYSKENIMEINLHGSASAKGAAVAFMTLNGMESLLSHQYFKTESQTEMYSDVLTAVLLPLSNTIFTKPVNFTIRHKDVLESGSVTCVYWDDNVKQWSVVGCWVAQSDENYTVCSCSHLSTFALIMQIGEPPPDNPFIDWLNRVCVIIGLFFFALAILTFLLCSWNPKINNTARLHLCINTALSQLLLLWNDKYVDDRLACKVMAGLLHFLVVASFVWMQLEALQLHLLVRRLSKVQVIQRDGLPRPILYLIGYGVPFVIVGVSALVYSDGYGATDAKVCWLSTQRHFNWALTGPVIVILALNLMLFCATLWSLRPTLANMKSDVSQSKDTRLILFKIVAQFVILGCTWILGLYQTNLFFQVLFIILNSQQGTLLYIVHCLLNKEVREEYIKWLTCSFGKDSTAKDALSVSEDLGKPEEKTG
ncbi:adhesion G protein-coupled receptor E1-like [Anabas testudineus]|uniref:adhesion G protein-coupled receptor E1-like n=1 Tax=Anabas testudineus TaxID=64144 RepID=UPI000E457AD0|nr:adhesion G protein-coupled receptor E1-like [Anabas testudineus]